MGLTTERDGYTMLARRNKLGQGNLMRYAFFVLSWLLMGILPVMPQAPQALTPDEIIQQSRDAFRRAKNPKEIESIKMWCKDLLASKSFPERNRLMVQALALMQKDQIAEANVLLKKVNDLEELDSNLAQMVCKPE